MKTNCKNCGGYTETCYCTTCFETLEKENAELKKENAALKRENLELHTEFDALEAINETRNSTYNYDD